MDEEDIKRAILKFLKDQNNYTNKVPKDLDKINILKISYPKWMQKPPIPVLFLFEVNELVDGKEQVNFYRWSFSMNEKGDIGESGVQEHVI